MRNVELKARDPEPARTLERALELGAEDMGDISQVDTYFAGARGRLKVREQEAEGAQLWDELIEYSREDSADASTSMYTRVPIADAGPLRDALDAAYGTLVTVTKRRRLLMWHGVRIHLDEVEGLGSFLEFEAVADTDSELSVEHEKIERLREELGVDDADLVAPSYSDLVLRQRAAARVEGAGDSAEELLRAAEAVMATAHVPYSHFPVGAALRGADGNVYAGSNVENAAYPQGQCAETSALGALIAAGQTKISEVAVTAERVDFCPPCGGCRQRLAEFAARETLVHLGRADGPRRTTTVGELLPLAFEFQPPG
jgi:homotetrameric cytidine deaminase